MADLKFLTAENISPIESEKIGNDPKEKRWHRLSGYARGQPTGVPSERVATSPSAAVRNFIRIAECVKSIH